MTVKQHFSVIMMALCVVVMIVLLVKMLITNDYRLWAVELAILCGFAVALRTYAFEWRRQHDQQERH